MSEFTSGPWTVMEPGTETAPRTASVCAHGGMVTIYTAPLTDETEATARLIAAAPDLLEALRSVLADHCRCAESKTQGGPIRDAYAAIAKAEGR